MTDTEFTLEEILANNELLLSKPTTDLLKKADVDFLYKLAIIGISSSVDQMGIELGVDALNELSRRAKLAEEISKRLP